MNGTFRTTVTLIGAGGTGSHMLHGLAMLDSGLKGIGHPGLYVTVWDQDAVEEHNVGRQRFAWSDIGLNKAHALVDEVNRKYALDWKAQPFRMDPGRMNHRIGNICITCVDTGKFRNDFDRLFKKASGGAVFSRIQEEHEGMHAAHYWLDLGNGKDFGQVVLGGEGLPTCVDVMGKYPKDEKDEPTCSMADSLKHQDLFINQQIAVSGLSILWDLFRRGGTRYPVIHINQREQRMRPKAIYNDHQEHQRL